MTKVHLQGFGRVIIMTVHRINIFYCMAIYGKLSAFLDFARVCKITQINWRTRYLDTVASTYGVTYGLNSKMTKDNLKVAPPPQPHRAYLYWR